MLSTSFYKELDRLSAAPLWNQLLDQSETSLPTDIYETEGSYVLRIAVPGVKRERIDIDLQRENLTVSVSEEKLESEPKYIRREIARAQAKKVFRVPDYIDRSGVSADLTDGILTIELRKGEAFKAKKIAIGDSSSNA